MVCIRPAAGSAPTKRKRPRNASSPSTHTHTHKESLIGLWNKGHKTLIGFKDQLGASAGLDIGRKIGKTIGRMHACVRSWLGEYRHLCQSLNADGAVALSCISHSWLAQLFSLYTGAGGKKLPRRVIETDGYVCVYCNCLLARHLSFVISRWTKRGALLSADYVISQLQ